MSFLKWKPFIRPATIEVQTHSPSAGCKQRDKLHHYSIFSFLAAAIMLLVPISPIFANDTVTLHVEWDYSPPESGQVLGYRLYINDHPEAICETHNLSKEMQCVITAPIGTTSFSMTALFSDGSETSHSIPYVIYIEQNNDQDKSPHPINPPKYDETQQIENSLHQRIISLENRAKAKLLFCWSELLFPEIFSLNTHPIMENEGKFYQSYPMSGLKLLTDNNELYYMDSDGVEHSFGNVDEWLIMLFADEEEKSAILFLWLEHLFPSLFAPSPQTTIKTNDMYYRSYPKTGATVAINAEKLYYINQNQTIELGNVDNLLLGLSEISS
ncbi:hypothetical protein SAMN05660653_00582 [Desulfonatronum thiosulfatophilum]|uniref:Uncharacterized protein n=1 Tax=Desulfonatronum thiosulfatophilum TaxID=617002 RepID=A0A1G6AUZ0_9BACT|nr:hypothetical protein [Desulfonatronum thiosulfatophilum]SDB12195.1 hypothetical protein SAMN05660653_00582 [Desulfonatronum thiosulfatophilum]